MPKHFKRNACEKRGGTISKIMCINTECQCYLKKTQRLNIFIWLPLNFRYWNQRRKRDWNSQRQPFPTQNRTYCEFRTEGWRQQRKSPGTTVQDGKHSCQLLPCFNHLTYQGRKGITIQIFNRDLRDTFVKDRKKEWQNQIKTHKFCEIKENTSL